MVSLTECYRTATTLAAKKAGVSEHPQQSHGLRCHKFGNNLNIIKFCFPGKEACRNDFESSHFLYIAQDLPFKLPQHFCRSVFLGSWEEPRVRAANKLDWSELLLKPACLAVGAHIPALLLLARLHKAISWLSQALARPCACSPRQMSCHLCFQSAPQLSAGLVSSCCSPRGPLFFPPNYWDRNVN